MKKISSIKNKILIDSSVYRKKQIKCGPNPALVASTNILIFVIKQQQMDQNDPPAPTNTKAQDDKEINKKNSNMS